jgi:hypothetical protein
MPMDGFNNGAGRTSVAGAAKATFLNITRAVHHKWTIAGWSARRLFGFRSTPGLRPVRFISSDARHRWVIETVERPNLDYSAKARNDKSRRYVRIRPKDIKAAIIRGGVAGGHRYVAEHGLRPAALVNLSSNVDALVYRIDARKFGVDLYETENGKTRQVPGDRRTYSSRALAAYLNRQLQNCPPNFGYGPQANILGRPLQREKNFYSLPDGYEPPKPPTPPVAEGAGLKVALPA